MRTTIGVANITRWIEIKKYSHQDMLIKLGIRARLDWERAKQNSVSKRGGQPACLLVCGVFWLVQE